MKIAGSDLGGWLREVIARERLGNEIPQNRFIAVRRPNGFGVSALPFRRDDDAAARANGLRFSVVPFE